MGILQGVAMGVLRHAPFLLARFSPFSPAENWSQTNTQNHALCAIIIDLSILTVSYCHSCVALSTTHHHPGWGVPKLGLSCPGCTLSEVLSSLVGRGLPTLILGNPVQTFIIFLNGGDLECLDSEVWVKSVSSVVLLTLHRSQRGGNAYVKLKPWPQCWFPLFPRMHPALLCTGNSRTAG